MLSFLAWILCPSLLLTSAGLLPAPPHQPLQRVGVRQGTKCFPEPGQSHLLRSPHSRLWAHCVLPCSPWGVFTEPITLTHLQSPPSGGWASPRQEPFAFLLCKVDGLPVVGVGLGGLASQAQGLLLSRLFPFLKLTPLDRWWSSRSQTLTDAHALCLHPIFAPRWRRSSDFKGLSVASFSLRFAFPHTPMRTLRSWEVGQGTGLAHECRHQPCPRPGPACPGLSLGLPPRPRVWPPRSPAACFPSFWAPARFLKDTVSFVG